MNGGRFGGSRMDEVADFLGMTVEELQAAYADGQTLSDILAEKNISEEAFQEAVGMYYNNDYDQALCDEDCPIEDPLFERDRLFERLNDPDGFFGQGYDGAPMYGQGTGSAPRMGLDDDTAPMMGQGMRGGRFGLNQ